MMAFRAWQHLPGVWHIEDAMGVCMTLLAGSERALLIDTGYGTEDVAAYVRTITDRPLTVMLTHGHHDHVMGAMYFDRVLMFPEDRQVFAERTVLSQRQKILEGARSRGLPVDEAAYLAAQMRTPDVLREGEIGLGGLTARIIRCPGHTPGSAVVYVPEHRLLLTGDDWNPCTWLFFPAALGVHAYKKNVSALLELPFERILCPHRTEMYPREMLADFLNALTDDTLRAARPVKPGPYPETDTREASLPGDQVLVFDWNKAEL